MTEENNTAETADDSAVLAHVGDSSRDSLEELKGFELVARTYAALGMDVFPAHSMYKRRNGVSECTCMPWKRKEAREQDKPEPMACENPAKHSRGVESWKKEATKDHEIIAGWARKFIDDAVNIGIATGPRSGCWVLDIDGDNGAQTLAALEAEHGPLPPTVVSVSGSGGKHYFFRWHPGMDISISAGQMGSGVDVRGDGGYVIAPPSMHKSGKRYAFAPGHSPHVMEIADAPEWLVKLASQRAADKKGRANAPKSKGKAKAKKSTPDDAQTRDNVRAGEATGFEEILATIGDGEGRGGFDTPIYRAACSWFGREGDDADADELKAALVETIQAAPEDAAKPRKDSRYLTDDYLNGRIEQARQFIAERRENEDTYIFEDEDALMEAMNRKVVMIFGTKTNTYVVEPDGDFILKPKTDAGDYLAPYKLKTVSKKGAVEFLSAFGIWKQHPARRQRRNFIFEPGMTESDIDFNTWKGFAIQPKKGDWEHLEWHMRNIICCGNEDNFRFLMALYANIFQEPRNKPGVATVMRGLKRIGKSMVGDAVCDIIGMNHSITLANRDDVTGRFNWHFAYRLFCLMEEAHWPGDHAGEAVLKQVIVGKRITLEQKFLDKIEISNHMRLNIIGNADWIVPTSEDDARFFALDVSPEKKGDHAYFTNLIESLRDGGNAAFHHALLEFNYSGMNLREPPVTEALRKQVAESFDAPDQWWRSVLVDGGFEGVVEGVAMDDDWEGDKPLRVNRKLVYASWLTGVPKTIQRTPDKAGRFLKSVVPELRTVKNDSERYYILPPLPELRAGYTAKYGFEFPS